MNQISSASADHFAQLDAELILSAAESTGLRSTGRFQQLNSMENRVYAVEIEDPKQPRGVGQINNLAWIVMDRTDSLPQSTWTYISRGELMGDSNGRLLIKAEGDVREVTRALLNQPTDRSVVFRIGKMETWSEPDGSGVRSHQSSYVDLVIDHGLLCQLSYSRPDGAVWHEQIFKDLTHPEWNNSPSKSNKTGCAFAGAPLP